MASTDEWKVIRNQDSQQNLEESMCNFAVSMMPGDGFAM